MPSTITFDNLLPEGLKAKDFQTVGVAYALAVGRTFIADEMGLGKTWQAALAVEAADAFPCVVVCPASLKGNWMHELRRLLPHRKAVALSGTIAVELPQADIYVINQDVLGKVDVVRDPVTNKVTDRIIRNESWAFALGEAKPKAVVLDESHYFKTPTAARTLCAKALAEAVPADGLVLLLTGTPLLNRPIELLSQLDILGTLAQVIKGLRCRGETKRDREFAFKFAFCGATHNGHGYDFNGVSNAGDLNERLRSTCYIRRERTDVLDMTETQRTDVVLSLNGSLSEYRAAEADFIAWVAANGGIEAVKKARRAEALTRLNTLRRLSSLAKVPATIEWIDNFFDSNPDKSLVVFADFVEVQKALKAHYDAPAILGGQHPDVTEAEKARFQAGESKLIVCSLKAAREGHTLVAASDVLFHDNPWHAGAKNQAEDRCNRIGQKAEHVFAWSLINENTVDEDIAAMVEHKRAVFQAVAQGSDEVWDDEDAATEVMGSLVRKAGA